MPKSRKWRERQNRAAMRGARGRQAGQSRSKPKRTGLVIGVIAVSVIAISAIYVINPGSLFGNRVINVADWSLYTGTKVRLVTSMGNITIQLRTDKPITTSNFLNLTNMGLYDNTTFHRVISGFMIQGGEINNVTIPNIADEIGSSNYNFNTTIAMANTGQANSANSQFFINVADNRNLYSTFDSTYTVFGRVTDGMNLVMAISHVSTDSNDKPVQDVTLVKAQVLP